MVRRKRNTLEQARQEVIDLKLQLVIWSATATSRQTIQYSLFSVTLNFCPPWWRLTCLSSLQRHRWHQHRAYWHLHSQGPRSFRFSTWWHASECLGRTIPRVRPSWFLGMRDTTIDSATQLLCILCCILAIIMASLPTRIWKWSIIFPELWTMSSTNRFLCPALAYWYMDVKHAIRFVYNYKCRGQRRLSHEPTDTEPVIFE